MRIEVPLGYPPGNEAYISQIQAAADALFPNGQVNLMRENLAFDDYLAPDISLITWRIAQRDLDTHLLAKLRVNRF